LKNFFRNNSLIGLAEILGRIPLVFAAGYIAKTLGPDDYGNWALAIAFQGIVISIAGLGLSVSISRLAAGATPEHAHGYLRTGAAMSAIALFIAAALTAALRYPISDLIGLDPDLSWLLLVACILAFVGALETLLDAFFKARELIARQATFVLSRSVIEVFSVITVFGGHLAIGDLSGPELLLVYAVLSTVLKLAAYPWLVVVRAPGHEMPPPEDRRAFLRYGIPMVPAAIVVFLTTQGDRLVLGHLVDKDQLGLYAFGASIASYVTFLGYAINPLLLPRASVLHDSGDHREVRGLFEGSQRVYTTLFVVVIAGLMLFGDEVIELTAGSAYLGSVGVMIILSVAIGLEGLLGIFQWIFHLVRRPSFILWFNLIYMGLNLAAVIVAATVGGIELVATAVLVVVVIANGVRVVVARRFIEIDIPLVVAVALVGLAAATPGLLALDDASVPLRIGLEVAIAAVAVALLVPGAVRDVVRQLRGTRPQPPNPAET
jgi:O-antigen/teichoic acid export membrane protein